MKEAREVIAAMLIPKSDAVLWEKHCPEGVPEFLRSYLLDADCILSALDAAGYVVVPKEVEGLGVLAMSATDWVDMGDYYEDTLGRQMPKGTYTLTPPSSSTKARR